MPFGPTPEHRGYGGYIDLRQETFERLIEDVLHSLVAQGFSRLVIWRGCGGHRLAELAERFNVANAGIARLWVPEPPYHEIWCSVADPRVPGGHADSFATSIVFTATPSVSGPTECRRPLPWRPASTTRRPTGAWLSRPASLATRHEPQRRLVPSCGNERSTGSPQ
jgi:creatinine amidohydrolase/Fe(II)-dependent formamide hydrolase-like protein